ncbi:NADH dehydrogenase [ubiquinone] 1 alpha subcomplex subunit 7-like [Ornithodoros turicata]|uniref:NADH dehydrogenase [ubiquinone] 1 alpha subcomplex subunit 7-like n=1 Tax=Ornithodoros turicata TaxID=34597 RepID=UPI00313A04F0
MAAAHREVSPALQLLRTFLLGRVANGQLRFPNEVATRSPPPPNLPPGPCSKLAENYYYTRDGRRVARQPAVILDASSGVKQIAAGGSAGPLKMVTPGPKYLP